MSGELSKFGPVDDLSVTYFYLGPRTAHDDVEIGPFRTAEAAGRNLRPGSPKSCIKSRSATGLAALKILENLEG